ncbi:hypothetical protein L3X38_032481 [Prunus dulcis]|uniref:Uncharacterized protein n=1 Tax=Prunus dulcis TaxID=3755 RepID=A0AAD4YW34_PRUDU|nr:hypothetical protein L3X38_032481 [Prunus dulcis]
MEYGFALCLPESEVYAAREKESDEENDGKGKGQKKGKKAVWSSARKAKENVEVEKPKRVNRPGWRIKGLNYALQWSWGSHVPECDATNVGLHVCKDLDELNSVVQQLRNEVAVLHREKDVRKPGDAGEERNKTEDAGEKSQKTKDEDTREESQKTEDTGEEVIKLRMME